VKHGDHGTSQGIHIAERLCKNTGRAGIVHAKLPLPERTRL
jgi:hypothetical protein